MNNPKPAKHCWNCNNECPLVVQKYCRKCAIKLKLSNNVCSFVCPGCDVPRSGPEQLLCDNCVGSVEQHLEPSDLPCVVCGVRKDAQIAFNTPESSGLVLCPDCLKNVWET